MLKSQLEDFAGGAVGKILPANATKSQLLSPHALEPVLHNKRSHCNQKAKSNSEE